MRFVRPLALSVAGALALGMAWSAPVSAGQPALGGQPVAATSGSPKVLRLFALTGWGGTLSAKPDRKRTYVLTLSDAAEQVVWSNGRPGHESGSMATKEFLRRWAAFGLEDEPPTVALVVRGRAGAKHTTLGVLTRPRLAPDGVFTARFTMLTGAQAASVGGDLADHAARHDTDVPSRFTQGALFIDGSPGTGPGGAPIINGCTIERVARCPGVDLSGVDLSRADLSAADLSGANLSRTNLSYALLKYARLSRANLTGATLRYADLNAADLDGAILAGANLSFAMMAVANLTGANLAGANLVAADLKVANLTNANLRGADLSYADLSVANRSGAITDATTKCPNGARGPCW